MRQVSDVSIAQSTDDIHLRGMEVILITMQEKNQTHKCPDSRN
jgi:hypothetical protein